jgi:putative thioredoxin
MSFPDIPQLRGAVDLSGLANKAAQAQVSSAGGTRNPGENAAPVAPGTPVPVPTLILEGSDANFTSILDLSQQVPVIVEMWAENSPVCDQLTQVLRNVILAVKGRLVLVRVNATENPQLSQAFQVQSVPTVAGVLAGRPLPLFSGLATEDDILALFDQVLELAAQNDVVGVAVASEDAGDESEISAPEPVLPPLHQEAYDAAERADYPAAIEAWKKALAANPADAGAKAGLAQITLLNRLQGKTMADIRAAAAADPASVSAQFDVADLGISGGHVEDAFDRLLALFPQGTPEEKAVIRERLLELFEVVGPTTPAVNAARARLTNLLY